MEDVSDPSMVSDTGTVCSAVPLTGYKKEPALRPKFQFIKPLTCFTWNIDLEGSFDDYVEA